MLKISEVRERITVISSFHDGESYLLQQWCLCLLERYIFLAMIIYGYHFVEISLNRIVFLQLIATICITVLPVPVAVCDRFH